MRIIHPQTKEELHFALADPEKEQEVQSYLEAYQRLPELLQPLVDNVQAWEGFALSIFNEISSSLRDSAKNEQEYQEKIKNIQTMFTSKNKNILSISQMAISLISPYITGEKETQFPKILEKYYYLFPDEIKAVFSSK